MKKLLFSLVFTLFVSIVFAQVSKTINVTTAGTLSSLLTYTEKSTITDLTVTGTIDARDFRCMRDDLTKLSNLDLDAVNIISFSGGGGPSYNSSAVYPANEIPEGAFYIGAGYGKTSLKKIILPKTITSIGNSSFNGCPSITEIIIPKLVTTISPFAFHYCTGLLVIHSLNVNAPTLGIDCFRGVSPTKVFIPEGAFASYKTNGWALAFNVLTEMVLSVKTLGVTSITLSTAILNGSLENITDSPVSAYGFCWNTTGSPTLNDTKIDFGAATKLLTFNYPITNITQGNIYYVKAFATDGVKTVYGGEISFKLASLPAVAGTISGPTSVCQGQNSVTYTVPIIANANSYIWSLPNGVTGASTSKSITVSISRTFISGEITVKGQNEWGEGATSSLTISANRLPADAGTITGRTTVCQGESNITYLVPEITDATSYIWTLPTGTTGTSTTNSITVNYSKTALTGDITVKGRNACGDGIASKIVITANKLPVITMSDKSLNCGSTVALNPTINYTGIGTLKFKWTPSTGLNNDSIANPIATVTNDITYTVTAITPNGCTVNCDVKIKIIPMDKPQIGIVGVNTSNKNIVVWNKPVSIGIDSYSIYRETKVSEIYEKVGSVPYADLSVFVDNSSNPDVKSNKYKISITDKSGQESPQSDPHKTIHLFINESQKNTWNLMWEPYTGFTASTYNIYRGTSATNLSFIDATSGSSTQYSDVTAPTGDVYYQLEVISPTLVTPSKVKSTLQKIKNSENMVTVSYNSSRSNIASNVTSGINELNAESNSIHVYPNPVKDQLKIDFIGGSTFEILNLMGQIVYTGNLNNSNIVQTSNFSSGVYLIKFNAGKTLEYKKFIKK